MTFRFSAIIYKVGINLCVDVPRRITDKMLPRKGYIPIIGHIIRHPFEQTLVPVKDAPYRLYVNGLMLKGSGTKLGDTVRFSIEQTSRTRKDELMPLLLRRRLVKAKLLATFQDLPSSRRKDILRYLNYLKTPEAMRRNVEKILEMLKG
jgi:hypothetical protein